MLTALLCFVILGWLCWKLSKFCKKTASDLREVAESESYFKQALLGSVQDIRDGVCPEEEEVDVVSELRKINGELKVREDQKKADEEEIEKLIIESDKSNII